MVKTHNYTFTVETQDEALQGIATQLGYEVAQANNYEPEVREKEVRGRVATAITAHNSKRPEAQHLHCGAGSSHIWVSLVHGDIRNTRIAIIQFENEY